MKENTEVATTAETVVTIVPGVNKGSKQRYCILFNRL